MGVLPGDILLPTFPAAIQIAIYFEYLPDSEDRETILAKFRLLLDDQQLGSGGMQGNIDKMNPVTFVLPKGILNLLKPGNLRFLVSVNDGPEQEIVNKRIAPQVGWTSVTATSGPNA